MSSDYEFNPDEVAGSGEISKVIAGEALPTKTLVYLNADGRYYVADASLAATMPVVAITMHASATGFPVMVLIKGYIGDVTTPWAWTTGSELYASDTAGAMGHAAGTVSQEVGIAVSATQIWFNPQGIDTGAVVGAHILATTGPHTNELPLTDLTAGARGEIISRTAADWAALGVGVAGQALLSGGVGADVSWGAPAPAAHEATHVRAGADDIDAALDARALGLTAQGEIVFHAAAATTLATLAVGVAGEALLSGGPAADISWGAPAPAAHEGTHNDGGTDEIEIDTLAGANGAAGEIVESDGAAMSFVEPDGRYTPAVHGATEHTDVTREIFLPANEAFPETGTPSDKGAFGIVSGGANLNEPELMFTMKVPPDFVSFTKVELIWSSPAAAGNMSWSFGANYGAIGEQENTHTDFPAWNTDATAGNDILNLDEGTNPLTLVNLALGDYLGIWPKRRGTHVDDTLDDVCLWFGVLFTYVASQ